MHPSSIISRALVTAHLCEAAPQGFRQVSLATRQLLQSIKQGSYWGSYLCESSPQGSRQVTLAHVRGRVHGREEPEVLMAWLSRGRITAAAALGQHQRRGG
jgi:hypothetical protein